MRLAKDTVGDWNNAKGPLQQDLIKLQKAYDDLQAQLLAQNTRLVETERLLTLGTPVIPVSGNVKIYKKINGDPNVPFGGSTPFTAAEVIIKRFTETNVGSTYFGLATTPRLLVAGVSGKVLLPLSTALFSKAVGVTGHTGAVTNGNTAWHLRWTTSANGNISETAGPANNLGWANGAGVGVTQRASAYFYPYWSSTNPLITQNGAGLYLFTAADMADPGTAAVPTLTIQILYCEMDISSV